MSGGTSIADPIELGPNDNVDDLLPLLDTTLVRYQENKENVKTLAKEGKLDDAAWAFALLHHSEYGYPLVNVLGDELYSGFDALNGGSLISREDSEKRIAMYNRITHECRLMILREIANLNEGSVHQIPVVDWQKQVVEARVSLADLLDLKDGVISPSTAGPVKVAAQRTRITQDIYKIDLHAFFYSKALAVSWMMHCSDLEALRVANRYDSDYKGFKVNDELINSL